MVRWFVIEGYWNIMNKLVPIHEITIPTNTRNYKRFSTNLYTDNSKHNFTIMENFINLYLIFKKNLWYY